MRKFERARSAALMVAIVVGALVVVELALRALGVKPHGGVLVSDDNCYFGWEPDARDGNTKGDLRHDLVTDADGFRVSGPGEPAGKPGCSVLALGDSFTEGLYVAAADTWPKVLQSLLQARGYRVRVDNGGMRGQTILQERIAALGRWQTRKYSVVVVEHTANDLMDLANAEAHGCPAGGPLPTTFHPAAPPWLRSLSLFRLAQDIGVRIEAWKGAAGAARRPVAAVAPSECKRLAADYVTEAGALADGERSSGGHLLLALWEHLWCDSSVPLDAGAATARLGDRLAASGGQLLDATTTLERPGATLQPRDNHPSPLGHRLFAERVASALDESGWLAQCRERAAPGHAR